MPMSYAQLSDPKTSAALKRRLTTILIADLAGYSRLMGGDEEGTHRRVRALFDEVLEPAIERHGGALIKKTGDGVLAEFVSVVEAVRCAIAVQRGVAEQNAGLSPDQNLAFRIGINLGDVIAEADDIYGDGVNIAARLETLAEPGGIAVSRSVRDHVRDRMKLEFEDLGEQVVKNIARPVRAFRIRTESGAGQSDRTKVRRRGIYRGLLTGSSALGAALFIGLGIWWLVYPASLPAVDTALFRGPAAFQAAGNQIASRLSIVVLPFANLSGDPQQDYFADGISQSLITDLSRALPGSFVVARGTAFTYKGREVDAAQVGRDVNVRYLLEGSVITDGDRLRVNARLIEAETSTELWAERFDSQRKDVLEIQNQIVARLSRSIGLELVDIEARRSERERPGNPSAIDLIMRARLLPTVRRRPTR
jgi:class 3 adenylate cyclase/TolB-like protein